MAAAVGGELYVMLKLLQLIRNPIEQWTQIPINCLEWKTIDFYYGKNSSFSAADRAVAAVIVNVRLVADRDHEVVHRDVARADRKVAPVHAVVIVTATSIGEFIFVAHNRWLIVLSFLDHVHALVQRLILARLTIRTVMQQVEAQVVRRRLRPDQRMRPLPKWNRKRNSKRKQREMMKGV